jgi:hypothetical protein
VRLTRIADEVIEKYFETNPPQAKAVLWLPGVIAWNGGSPEKGLGSDGS